MTRCVRFLLLVCVSTILTASSTATAATTWYVDASQAACPGSGTPLDPFCTIGAAVAAASSGDTIRVAAGTYNESVHIDKNDLRLIGAGADRTTIVGDPANHVVGPAGFMNIAHFRLEGFRITSSDPGPGLIIGIQASLFVIDGSILIENTVIINCDSGIYVYGSDVTIRNCTIFGMAMFGVQSTNAGSSSYELANTIIANTGWWAAAREEGETWNVHHVLVFANNLHNPAYAPHAGTFIKYSPEKGGYWITVPALPGPISTTDPFFVDAGLGDLRIQGSSPAIDSGDPSTPTSPAQSYDLFGFGHPRLDDGDFDDVERIDIGAVEFGGLLAVPPSLAVGETLSITQWGRGDAFYGLFLGFHGTPLAIGLQGTLFLDPSLLILLGTGTLSGAGTKLVLSGPVPPVAAGFTVHFQAVQNGPSGQGLHWTNLEQVRITP